VNGAQYHNAIKPNTPTHVFYHIFVTATAATIIPFPATAGTAAAAI
jgi:hypothetical protein